MFIALVGGIFLGDSPLNSIQMLWVNLIIDTFAALALATEPPKEEIIRGKPYPKNESIVTPVMWRNVIGQAVFQIVVLSILLFFGHYFLNADLKRPDEPWTQENGFHYTIIFNVYVFMNLFNEINCRKIHENGKLSNSSDTHLDFNVFENFFNNPLFLMVVLITIVVQIVLVQFGGEAVKCSRLTIE